MTSVMPTLSPTPSLLVHVFGQRATAMPHALAYAVYPKGARQAAQRITWGELHSASRAFAARLLIAGVRAGDRIAIHAGNRPLWPLADLAVQMVGAIGVGIFPASAPSQVEAMLADAQPVLAITDTAAAFATVREAKDRLGANFPIVGVGEGDGEGNSTGQPVGAAPRWEEWRTEGEIHLNASAVLRAELDTRIAALAPDDIAALIYTSGSTGEPKGALISHRCLAASAQSIAMVLELQSSDSSVSFLPFSHAAERVFGQCTRIHAGMASALVEDPADVFTASADFQPTLFGALPRIFERLYEAAEIARHDGASARDAITQRIGARCRIATSGGAALPARIALELEALGLPVLGAYGQTEHLCVAMNRRDCMDADTVGFPMPGTEVRIAADGEVQIRRSALTFSGYLNKPDETRDAFTPDGKWLRTGDRGQIDSVGRLRITGRAKELIALSNGRKIAPLPIEAELTASPFIAHAVCHGEGHKYLVALLSLRQGVVTSWARTHGVSEAWPALAQHPRLRAELQLVSKSNGFIGPGLTGQFRNRSAFRGAEQLLAAE